MLVDATPARAARLYDALVPETCQRFIGPNYALMASDFAHQRQKTGARPRGAARRLLISLGATDPANLTSVALDAVRLASLELEVDVLLGPAAPHRDEIYARAAELGARVQWSHHTADLVSRVDVAIGAAGGSALERCCLGLPTVLLVGAENQRDYAAALARAGAVELVEKPVTAQAVAGALHALVSHDERRAEMSRRAATVCDGLGARRIALALAPAPRASDGTAVSLRPATARDAQTLLEWQLDPRTRRYARDPQPPTRDEHHAWLDRKLTDPRCIMNIVLRAGKPAGMVRLDLIPEREAFEVSINIAAEHARLGVGRAALALASRLVPDATLRAFILTGNEASQRLFLAAGYRPEDVEGWYVLLPAAAAAARAVLSGARLQ
jgi:RimJ/RimL family protein N-acetyltransferase